jgi:hypothetical protein
VAYVQFAVEHRAHMEVMFRTDLYDVARPAVLTSRAAAADALARGIDTLPESVVGADRRLAGLAAWSLVHGFAGLWISGALPHARTDEVGDVARAVARFLFDPDRGAQAG